jgi:hypothetical protein
MIQRETEVQIDDQFVHCVAFIGVDTARGFRPEGTCFFLNVSEEEQTFTYAITAGHVIHNFPRDTITVRAQRKAGLPPKKYETQRAEWVFHHDRHVDICAYAINWRNWDVDGDLNILSLTVPQILLTQELGDHFGFGLGSDIFMPSAFIYVAGEKQNIPVVRFGNIAAMPIEPFVGSPRKPPFLIETRSIGGMSGSPVLFHTDPARKYRRQPLQTDPATGLRITPYFLIGMLLGGFDIEKSSADFVSMDAEAVVRTADVQFNSGMSIVLPHSQITELINQKELKKARARTLSEIRNSSGYREA